MYRDFIDTSIQARTARATHTAPGFHGAETAAQAGLAGPEGREKWGKRLLYSNDETGGS